MPPGLNVYRTDIFVPDHMGGHHVDWYIAETPDGVTGEGYTKQMAIEKLYKALPENKEVSVTLLLWPAAKLKREVTVYTVLSQQKRIYIAVFSDIDKSPTGKGDTKDEAIKDLYSKNA